MSVFPSRRAEVRPRMFPASTADRQPVAGQPPLVRRAADHRSYRQADLACNDLDPACPRCGDLCPTGLFNCPACGSALYPYQNSEAIAPQPVDRATASPTERG